VDLENMKPAFGLFLLLAASLTAAEVSGPSTGYMRPVSGVAVWITLTLQERGQEVSGSIAFGPDARPAPIDKVWLRGDKLTFDAPDGVNRVVAFQLTVADGYLGGEATVEGQTLKVNLAPAYRPEPRQTSPMLGPRLIHKVEPEYTEEARNARLQGTVWLKVEITPEGKATNIKVLHALGMGLDEKAVECVTKWRFKPGMKDGQPVTVEAQTEVNFRLLEKPTR
jgi:TonB family protein